MMSAGTGALGSAPRRPLASVARTDYSLRCGAKSRSPCPIATGAFTETVCFGPTRGHRQKWRFFMFARVFLDFAKLTHRRDMDDDVCGDALAVTVREVARRAVRYVRRSRRSRPT